MGIDPIIAAWRAWILGSLLNNPTLGNQKKYLVAVYNKKIIASYCIHGVAQDIVGGVNRLRRVRTGQGVTQ